MNNDIVGSSINDNSCTTATPEGWARSVARIRLSGNSWHEQDLHTALITMLQEVERIRKFATRDAEILSSWETTAHEERAEKIAAVKALRSIENITYNLSIRQPREDSSDFEAIINCIQDIEKVTALALAPYREASHE